MITLLSRYLWPIGLLVALALGGWYLHVSAVNRAVDAAEKQLVKDAERKAQEAMDELVEQRVRFAEEKYQKLLQRSAQVDAAANDLRNQLARSYENNQNLEDEIQEMLQRPEPDRCVVDADLYERLR